MGEILSNCFGCFKLRRKLRVFLQFLAAKVPFFHPADCSLDKPLLHRQPSLPVRLQLLLDRHVLLAYLKDSGRLLLRLLPPLVQSSQFRLCFLSQLSPPAPCRRGRSA